MATGPVTLRMRLTDSVFRGLVATRNDHDGIEIYHSPGAVPQGESDMNYVALVIRPSFNQEVLRACLTTLLAQAGRIGVQLDGLTSDEHDLVHGDQSTLDGLSKSVLLAQSSAPPEVLESRASMITAYWSRL